MEMSLSRQYLLSLLERQLNSFFPITEKDCNSLGTMLDESLNRLEICLHSRINGYLTDGLGGGQIYKV